MSTPEQRAKRAEYMRIWQWKRRGGPLPDTRKLPDLPDEEWRPVAGYEGAYAVSSFGRIRHLPTRRIRVQHPGTSGYARLTFSHQARRRNMNIHDVVAAAFLPPRPTPQHEIDHIDGNKMNPAAKNLEWVTRSENARRRVVRLQQYGAKHHHAKLTEDIVRAIRCADRTITGAAMARQYGVSVSTVCRIREGKAWKHTR